MNSTKFPLLVALILTLCGGLNSCSSTNPSHEPFTKTTAPIKSPSPWLKQSFQLNGKIALRYPYCPAQKTRSCQQKAVSAALDWLHRKNHEEITLSDPLGQPALAIKIKDDQLIVNDGKKTTTLHPEEMQQHLGINLPVDSLPQWLFMLRPADKFQENGWEITASDWQNDGFYRNITLKQEKYFIKIFIQDINAIK